MILTDEQELAVQEITNFFIDDNQKYLVVNAIAGAGKSTILNQVLKNYEYLTAGNAVLQAQEIKIVAPTHKAVSVLADMDLPIYGTLHRFIQNLKIFTAYPLKNTILIIDESSFIGVDMYSKLMDLDTKILFIGDKYQLPPIKNNFSPVFYSDLPTIGLSHSIRLKPDVLDYCHKLRKAIDNYSSIPELPNTGSFIHIGLDELKTNHNSDYPILCLRNSTVDKMNKHIIGRSDIQVGDLVYVDYGNSLDKQIARKVLAVEASNFKGIPTILYSVDYDTGFNTLQATRYKKDRKILHHTVEVKHTYAITVHKSQGSTYDGVYIVLDDYLNHRDKELRLKLLYTAISRSKGDIYVIHR